MAVMNIPRTEEEIIRGGRDRLRDNVGINADNSTSTAKNMLDLIAGELTNTWDTMNSLLRTNFLSTANGEDLDKIGDFVQEPRRSAKRALDLSTTNFYFYLDKTYAQTVGDLLRRYYTSTDRDELFAAQLTDSQSNPTEIRIPAGALITTEDGKVGYTTVNSIVLSNTDSIDYSPVISTTLGDSSNVGPNSLIHHNLTYLFPLLSKISDAIKCTNRYAIRSGSDYESDENYRYRLSNKVVSSAGGNETAVRRAVLSVPGVVDLSMVKRSNGNGTYTIFPRTVDPIVSDGIINAVFEAVNQVKSVGDIPYVQAPSYLAVIIRIDLRFAPGAEKTSIYGDARLAVMDYINNLEEGGEIVINEVIQRVMSVDNKIVDMSITELGYGSYNRTSGTVTGYTPLRLVNQRANYDERFYTNSKLCNLCEAGSI
jgi:uncharacterized phage protein gp47/JayE